MKHVLLFISFGLAVTFGNANASFVIDVEENVNGGTNWIFSGGDGQFGDEGTEFFLAGGTAANPQPFVSSSANDTSLTVLSGVNTFNIKSIGINFFNVSGTNGIINDGLEIKSSTVDLLDNALFSSFDGLIFHADSIDIASLNPGTYSLRSFRDDNSRYYTSIGEITLNVANELPIPPSILLFVFGLAGLLGAKKTKTQMG